MELTSLGRSILQEIGEVLSRVDEGEVSRFIEVIWSSEKVFVIGVGRVMLMAQAFAKRLRHLGLESYVVGETTVPPIGEKDVLLACSASGETLTTVGIARLAKSHGAKVLAVTANRDSSLGKLANHVVVLRCPTKLHLDGEAKSIQPMGSLYEQSLLIFFDSVSLEMKEELGLTEAWMWAAHANLE